jgi:hypothetical protein
MDERFLGSIKHFDPSKRLLTIQVDFMMPDQQEIIENILKDNQPFSFWFNKPFRQSKSYAQLKKYYLMLGKILDRLEVFQSVENIRAFDIEIKKTAFPSQFIEIFDKRIPVIPSKANMSLEEMSNMIQVVEENYGQLLEEE